MTEVFNIGDHVCLTVDSTITGWVRGWIDTPNFGPLALVSWGEVGPEDRGEPEHPDHLAMVEGPVASTVRGDIVDPRIAGYAAAERAAHAEWVALPRGPEWDAGYERVRQLGGARRALAKANAAAIAARHPERVAEASSALRVVLALHAPVDGLYGLGCGGCDSGCDCGKPNPPEAAWPCTTYAAVLEHLASDEGKG